MNYKLIYEKIISRGKTRGLNKKSLDYYTEKHHIIPRCVGGKDEEDNYVLLTAKEHILCHILLTKIYPNESGIQQAALLMKSINGQLNLSLKLLSDIKEKAAKGKVGKHIHSKERKELLSKKWTNNNPNKGKDMTGANNPASKKIVDGNGTVYDSTKQCASIVGHNVETIRRWCRKGINGYHYYGQKINNTNKTTTTYSKSRCQNISKSINQRTSNGLGISDKVVDQEGKEFNSVTECAKYHKKAVSTILNWLKNPSSGYKYLK